MFPIKNLFHDPVSPRVAVSKYQKMESLHIKYCVAGCVPKSITFTFVLDVSHKRFLIPRDELETGKRGRKANENT